jgi:hypothetical protein
MNRVFLAVVAILASSLIARAKDAAVELRVRPMPAPTPALKYQLLPELGELNPGNAAQSYLKCFMEQRTFFYSKQAMDNRARYLDAPLAKLPVDKLLSEYGGGPLNRADWGARLDTIDWQAMPRTQSGSFELLPADLGPLQVLGESLRVRFRAEVAGRRFDDAVRTAQTMFALARHLGEYPREVAVLIGLWTAHACVETLREMVQQPSCPNLYWALTDLPCPLVDLRKGVQGDRALVAAELRRLRQDAPMTDAELDAFVGRISGAVSFARQQAGLPPLGVRTRLHARAANPDVLKTARRRLVAAGYAANVIDKLPPLQVILLDDKRDYEIQRDEREKRLGLPLWQLGSSACVDRANVEEDGFFAGLLPEIDKLHRARGRLEQEIALLRQVEALRIYAALHDGMLPASLATMPVPLPADPITGGPFVYTLEGAAAHLRNVVPQDEAESAYLAIHYVITVQK